MREDFGQLFTLDEARARLGAISRATIGREIQRGHLPYVRVGQRGVRVTEADLNAYIEQRRSQRHVVL